MGKWTKERDEIMFIGDAEEGRDKGAWTTLWWGS